MNGTCIFFDLDGTLVDSLPGIEFSVREAFNTCGLPPPKRSLREVIGPPIRKILSQIGNVTDENTLDALERVFRTSYDGEGWRKTVCFAGVEPVLRMMQEQGHRLFVVSNKPRHVSLQILRREKIIERFEAIVTRDSRSPQYHAKEEMLEALLSDGAISREKCLMVGDTTEDAMAAAAVGIKFVWMAHGYGTVNQIPPICVAHSLDDFAQLPPLIKTELVCDR
jgi:phosphoglycolate phosphatase